MDSLEVLLETTLASSAALLLVLGMRKPLRKAFGACVAYGAWALVPAALAAVLLPAAAAAPGGALPLALPRMLPGMMQSAAGGRDPGGWLAAGWLAGAALCAAAMALQQWRFRRGLGRLLQRADGVREAERDSAGLPATLGLWSPLVVVPPGFDTRYDPTRRELMLAHERAHVQRGDVQANALVAALRCLFWFNPLLHAAAAHFRHDQELACDAAVLAAHPRSRRNYGEALLHAQLQVQASPLGCHFGFGHPLKERIEMLRQQLPTRSRRLLGTALVSALALGCGFAAWAAQPPQAASQPATERDAQGVFLPPPKYPAYAAEHNLSGNVVMIVDVASDGSVSDAIVERSEPKGMFDEQALAAVKQWRFTPAMKGGMPVAGRVRVPIQFRPDQPSP